MISVDCRTMKSRLLAFLDGSLETALQDQIGKHLSHCADCSRLVATVRPLLEPIGEHPGKAPDSLWRRVQENINAAEQRETSRRSFPLLRRQAFAYTVQSLGVAVAVLIGVFIGDFAPAASGAVEDDEVIEYYASAFATVAVPVADLWEQLETTTGEER